VDVRFIGTPQECAEASLRLRREFGPQVTRQSRQKPARQPGLVMVYLAIVLDPPGKQQGGDPA
jgi:hypothetical protein